MFDFGMDQNQTGHAAGALVLAALAVVALRRAWRAGDSLPAAWLAVAAGLAAGGAFAAARGFPGEVPAEAVPWLAPERLVRAWAVASLVLAGLVFLSAHWVRDALGRWAWRAAGLAALGAAVGLTAAWFGEELPAEARRWAVREAIARAAGLAALLLLAVACWTRDPHGPPRSRWALRWLTPALLAGAVGLFVEWFGPDVLPADVRGWLDRWNAADRRRVGGGGMRGHRPGGPADRPAGGWSSSRRSQARRAAAAPPPPRPLPVATRLPDEPRAGIQ